MNQPKAKSQLARLLSDVSVLAALLVGQVLHEPPSIGIAKRFGDGLIVVSIWSMWRVVVLGLYGIESKLKSN